MSKKYLIDINVCLDLLLKRKNFYHPAGLVFQLSEEGYIQATISSVSFSTIFYFLDDEYGHKKAIRKIRRIREISHVSKTGEKVIDAALDSGWKDFEDAIQYYCAIYDGCDGIITRNAKDYKNGNDIPVLSPAVVIEKHQ